MLKHMGIVAVVAIMSCLALEVGEHAFGLDRLGVVTKAEARVGRPLTPMSVAGVTRRTVRRCAVGVYNC
jgi:hypothetical protein